MVLGLNDCAVWYCSTYFATSPSLCARASPRAHPPTQHLLSCFPRVISCWLVSRLLPAQLSKCPFLQSPLTSLAISFKPWCPQLCGTTVVFRQWFPSSLRWRSDFLVTQPGNPWLILLLSSSGPQCAILWVSESPLQVTQGSFPWAKIPVSGSRKASHGAHRSSEDPGERHLHSPELHQHQAGSSAGLRATKT